MRQILRDYRLRLASIICLSSLLGIDARLLAEGPKARATLQGHTTCVSPVAFSPDATMVAAGSRDGLIKIWDVATGKERASFKGHADSIMSVAFDGKNLVSGGKEAIKVWDVAGQKGRTLLDGPFPSLFISPHARALAVRNRHGTLEVWDVSTAKRRARLSRHIPNADLVSINPDGTILASGGSDGSIKLWEVATGRERANLTPNELGVTSVAFSHDGKSILLGGAEDTITLWEVATGKERVRFRGHSGSVMSVAFSPDRMAVASGSLDKTVKVWEITGKERVTFTEHTYWVLSVAFSPDGKTLASGSSDNTVKLWDVPSAGPARKPLLSGKDLEEFWNVLSQDDAARAFQAIHGLISAPNQSVHVFKERLQPAIEPERVTLLIADLDSDSFAIRRKATEELENAGDAAESVLRKKLSEKPSLEVRQRVERLLQGLASPSGNWLGALRSIEVLENIGSPDATKVLEKLATGADGARLTREAKASLVRLRKRAAMAK